MSGVESVSPLRDDTGTLSWRVHLLAHNPRPLPALCLAIVLAAVAMRILFGHWLPAAAAALLLLGATSEYLFPMRFRIDSTGVFATTTTGRFVLKWPEARRCAAQRGGLYISPLAAPSRLDAFRGVTLRYAPDGEPGDRRTVLAAIARFAPRLLESAGGAAPGGAAVRAAAEQR